VSHVKSSVIERIEEHVRKVMFIDSSPLFDQVLDLSGPTTPARKSGVERLLSKAVSFVINLSQYFSIAEFDVKKYGIKLTEYLSQYFSIAEFDVKKYGIKLTEYLESLRSSLEASITISSLLAGVLTTIVMLVIAVLGGVS